jgi:hypothetical protein
LRLGRKLRGDFLCGYAIGGEDMAASRTLERRTIGGENSFIDAIAGMTTSTLDLDHRHISPIPSENTIHGKGAQLLALGE